jgi:putative sigma-54 modulation protein
MQVIVKGTNLKISPQLREHSEKRLNKLTRFFSKFDEAKVTCRAERNWQIADVTLQAGGLMFRSEERTDNMFDSIDAAATKLERQLKRFREKITSRLRKEDSSLTAAIDEQLNDASNMHLAEPENIVRRKRFLLKPMPTDEAVLQMELLHHDFYVFSNTETNRVNVLYRRKGGGYGLIEPEG